MIFLWRSRSFTLAALVSVFAAAAFASTAQAQDFARAELELIITSETAVGDTVQLQAVVTADGAPLPEIEVIFRRSVEFFNTGSEVLIGRATTDAAGRASVDYSPRSEGEVLITAEFDGVAGITAAYNETTIFVATGPAQYSGAAGVSVPGINVLFLVAILSAVWGTYFVVMVLVWLIARDGSATPSSGSVQ